MHKVLYIQYTNPAGYPSLEHSSRILADAGWKILFLGTGAAGMADVLRFRVHNNIVVRRIPFGATGVRQKLHYLWFVLWVVGWTLAWRPRWIYISDLLACPLGFLLSFLPGARLVYHEHDSPDGFESGLFRKFALWARKKLAWRSQICVLPNQQRVDRFSRDVTNGKRVLRVWNCPGTDEISESRNLRQDGELWVYYHGSLGPSYLPINVLNAFASLPHCVRLLAIGYETVGCVGYVQRLKAEAARLGLSGRVEFLDAMPRYQLLDHCNRYDVGIALMPKRNLNGNEKAMVGASNKAFDYLACGLALLVTDLPDWRELYVDPGYGLVCDPDEPDSIATALRWFLDHPDQMREMGERGRQRVLAEWNYERQFAPILREMMPASLSG